MGDGLNLDIDLKGGTQINIEYLDGMYFAAPYSMELSVIVKARR